MDNAVGSCFVLSVAVFWRGVAFLKEPQCFFNLIIYLIIYCLFIYFLFFIAYSLLLLCLLYILLYLAMATDDRKSHIKDCTLTTPLQNTASATPKHCKRPPKHYKQLLQNATPLQNTASILQNATPLQNTSSALQNTASILQNATPLQNTSSALQKCHAPPRHCKRP